MGGVGALNRCCILLMLPLLARPRARARGGGGGFFQLHGLFGEVNFCMFDGLLLHVLRVQELAAEDDPREQLGDRKLHPSTFASGGGLGTCTKTPFLEAKFKF